MNPTHDDTDASAEELDDTREQITRYVSGAMDPEERAAFERTVLADDLLAEKLYAELNLEAGLEKVASFPAMPESAPTASQAEHEKLSRPVPWWRRLHVTIVVPVVAVAVLVMLITRPGGDGDGPTGPSSFRGQGDVIQAVSPAGDISEPAARFVWTRVPDADAYRFELYDTAMVPLFQTTVRDTQLVWSDHAPEITFPSAGRWKVTATSTLGLALGTSVQSFRTVKRSN